MILKDKLTMVIHSCDKFSDLWDAHFTLLEKNWNDRGIETFLVTDSPTEKEYDNVRIISAGEGKELSERTQAMLEHIKTEYVLITLDDYFLIQNVDNRKIERILEIMEKEKLDYVRLFLRPKYKRADKWQGYDKFYHIDNNRRYGVNLYTAIWRKDFIAATIDKPLNAWKYEVSLSKKAREYGAKGAVSLSDEFKILDVVRKGKILRKANRYFKKHDLYHGTRPVMSLSAEIKLGIRTWGARLMPVFVTNIARNIMIKLGHHYYSQDE